MEVVFYFIVNELMETYCQLTRFSAKIRQRHVSAWRNLTRPLKPTNEEAIKEAKASQRRDLIAHLNRDTNNV
jgi:hypothetical protein